MIESLLAVCLWVAPLECGTGYTTPVGTAQHAAPAYSDVSNGVLLHRWPYGPQHYPYMQAEIPGRHFPQWLNDLLNSGSAEKRV